MYKMEILTSIFSLKTVIINCFLHAQIYIGNSHLHIFRALIIYRMEQKPYL